MLRVTKWVLLALLICATGWAFLNLLSLVNAIRILDNWRNYRETTFVVAKVKYRESTGGGGPPGGGGGSPIISFWAEGTIDGDRERYSLSGEVPHMPESQEDLEKMVRPGDEFRVWYNSGMTQAIVQNQTLRVLPQRKHPKYWSIRFLARYIFFCLLPVILFGIGFGIACHRLKRAERRKFSA